MNRTQDDLTQEERKSQVEVIRDKKRGKVDDDWCDICIGYDLGINTETLRKAAVGIKQAEDAGLLMEPGVDMQEENPLLRNYMERQKIRDLTNQANEMLRSESRSEQLRETIRESIANMPPLPPIVYAPLAKAVCKNKSLVLTIGDFHYGSIMLVEGLNGETLNEYNHTVFERRMLKQLAETADILKKEGIRDLYVFMLGDLIDGMIHQPQLMKLEYGIIDSTMRLSEFLANWLAELSRFATIHVYSASGNHSEIRPLRSKHREFPDENLERIIMWYLEERLCGVGNLFVDSDCKRMTLVKQRGFHFLLLHGDEERNIEKMARNTINLYGHPIDFFVCGHLHKESEYPSGTTNHGDSVIIRTPSICGMSNYSQTKGYGGSAGAIATVIEEGYGRRCVYPIRLS